MPHNSKFSAEMNSQTCIRSNKIHYFLKSKLRNQKLPKRGGRPELSSKVLRVTIPFPPLNRLQTSGSTIRTSDHGFDGRTTNRESFEDSKKTFGERDEMQLIRDRGGARASPKMEKQGLGFPIRGSEERDSAREVGFF